MRNIRVGNKVEITRVSKFDHDRGRWRIGDVGVVAKTELSNGLVLVQGDDNMWWFEVDQVQLVDEYLDTGLLILSLEHLREDVEESAKGKDKVIQKQAEREVERINFEIEKLRR